MITKMNDKEQYIHNLNFNILFSIMIVISFIIEVILSCIAKKFNLPAIINILIYGYIVFIDFYVKKCLKVGKLGIAIEKQSIMKYIFIFSICLMSAMSFTYFYSFFTEKVIIYIVDAFECLFVALFLVVCAKGLKYTLIPKK